MDKRKKVAIISILFVTVIASVIGSITIMSGSTSKVAKVEKEEKNAYEYTYDEVEFLPVENTGLPDSAEYTKINGGYAYCSNDGAIFVFDFEVDSADRVTVYGIPSQWIKDGVAQIPEKIVVKGKGKRGNSVVLD